MNLNHKGTIISDYLPKNCFISSNFGISSVLTMLLYRTLVNNCCF